VAGFIHLFAGHLTAWRPGFKSRSSECRIWSGRNLTKPGFAPYISVFAHQYVSTAAPYSFFIVTCIIQYQQLTDWLNKTFRNTETSVRDKSYPSKYFLFRPVTYSRITSSKSLPFCIKIFGVSLTSVTALLLQSRDSSCNYVGRRILVPPPLPLHRHADLHAHEFACSALVTSP